MVDGTETSIRLDELVDLVNSGTDVLVKSRNLETDAIEYKLVTAAAMTARDAELIEIEDEDSGKVIRCTPDHKIFTKNRGYVMAKDLMEADILDIQ